MNELHFSEAVYGLGAGIFFIGYFPFEVPSNILHRLGVDTLAGSLLVLTLPKHIVNR